MLQRGVVISFHTEKNTGQPSAQSHFCYMKLQDNLVSLTAVWNTVWTLNTFDFLLQDKLESEMESCAAELTFVLVS